jgi:aryl-alcohol dehydrogenase-like predicted oxidoreductase
VEDMATANRIGISTFDTADIYGGSEELIGTFRRQYRPSQAEVFTKLCCFSPQDMAAARTDTDAFVRAKLRRSQRRLGYADKPLDCVQFYWHDYGQQGYLETIEGIVRARDDGLVACVGVTNFSTGKLRELLEAAGGRGSIKFNQIQFNLLDSRPKNGQQQFCLDNNIGILAFGTVLGGLLSDKYLGLAPSQVRLNTYSLQKYASIIRERGGWDWYQGLLRVLRAIADQYPEHNIGIAEVAQKYVLQQDAVAAIIVGARNADHLRQHANLFSFQLKPSDLDMIDGYVGQAPPVASDVYEWERGYSEF